MNQEELFDLIRGISIAAQEAICTYGDRVMRGSQGARIHAVAPIRGALYRRGFVTYGPMPVLTRLGWQAYNALVDVDSAEYKMSADPDACMRMAG